MKEKMEAQKVLLVVPYFISALVLNRALKELRKSENRLEFTISFNQDNFNKQDVDNLKESYPKSHFIIFNPRDSNFRYIMGLRKNNFNKVYILTEKGWAGEEITKVCMLAGLTGVSDQKIVSFDPGSLSIEFSENDRKNQAFKAFIPWRCLALFSKIKFQIKLFLGVTSKVVAGRKDSPGQEAFDVICFSTLDWTGDMFQRPHYLMDYISKKQKVLFIGPQVFPFSKEHVYEKTKDSIVPEKVSEKLYVYNPVITKEEKSPLFSMFSEDNKKSIIKQIQTVIRRSGLSKYVVYMGSPGWGGIEREIESEAFIYDCFDRYEEFSHMPKEEAESIVSGLMRKADIVLASSDDLFDYCKGINPKTQLLKNAVNFDLFAQKRENSTKELKDIAAIRKPIIGYHGAIAEWMDVDLMDYIAKIMKDCSIVFVGPVQCDVSRLKENSNVYFLGMKQSKDIPFYVDYFDVGVIPFKLNKLTLSVNPLKMYEYFSLGKPVVSVALPEVEQYNEVADIITNGEEAVLAIKEAFSGDESAVKRRIKIAEENSWKKRGQVLSDIVDRIFLKNREEK